MLSVDTAVLLTFNKLRDIVDPIRRRSLVPGSSGLTLADVIPPHMTVASPACPDPLGEDAGERLRRSAEGVGPFSLTFSEVKIFPQGTVYLAPEPCADLGRLFARIADQFGEFGGIRDDHVWHLSIARRGGDQLAVEIRRCFKSITATVTSVSIWRQAAAGLRWAQCQSATLNGTIGRGAG
jgi:2'-5' RNA ligase